jgi:hypothetical protein
MILLAVVRAERLVAKRRAYAGLQNADRENEAYPELAGKERKGEVQASCAKGQWDVAKSGQENASCHGTKLTVEKTSCTHPVGILVAARPCNSSATPSLIFSQALPLMAFSRLA